MSTRIVAPTRRTGQSLAARLATENAVQEAYAASERQAALERARQATTAPCADGTRGTALDHYARLAEQEARQRRIAGATDAALREVVRQNIRATATAREGLRKAVERKQAMLELHFRLRLRHLRLDRQTLLDIRRIARESVDG